MYKNRNIGVYKDRNIEIYNRMGGNGVGEGEIFPFTGQFSYDPLLFFYGDSLDKD